MEVQEVKEQLKSIFRTVINNDKWITIHPNGEDGKGRPLLLKDGETPKEAIDRVYKKEDKKQSDKQSDSKDDERHENFRRSLAAQFSDYGNIERKRELTKRAKEWREKGQDKIADLIEESIELGDKTNQNNKDFINKKISYDEYVKFDRQAEKRRDEIGEEIEQLQKQPDTKEGKEEKKSTFKPVKGIMQSLKDDYEAGKINAKEVAKELSKANLTPYLLDDNEALEKIGVKQSDTKDKQSDSKGDLDIKKTTVKMKSGKTKEIEYVDSVPEGYKKLEGAMTAPLGYTWYHNGKSIIDKERKTILVKDKVNNNKEQDMTLLDELKKLITKVENNKENEIMVENEKVDKRKLIDEVAGIMKSAGCDDEDIRTAIGKMEKIGYDDSEASADNKKVKNEADEEDKDEDKKEEKVDNESEEDKEKVEDLKKEEKKDIDNKCKNSKEESYFDKLNKIYNSAKKIESASVDYEDKQTRLDAGKEYFG